MRAHGLRGGPPERECEDDPLLGRDRIGNWDNRPTNLEDQVEQIFEKDVEADGTPRSRRSEHAVSQAVRHVEPDR